MAYAECETCHEEFSILPSMVTPYISKFLPIINMDLT
jgi:hypothetical protein